ncbi:MAG: cobalamin-binding protein [Polyangiaceae bacterium]
MTVRFVLVAVAAWAIVACSRSDGSQAAGLYAAGARRVVSLAPSTTEALFAIGAGDRVVGRSRFCDFPPEAKALPIVGDVEPDIEAILELRPDLVVGVDGLTSARTADRLKARGIPSWFSDPNSLTAIGGLLRDLGERTGHAKDADRLAQALTARELAIERAVAGAPKPRVLFVVSVAPIIAAGPDSFADELIQDAGGENVVSDGGAWPAIGFERILDMDPDVILDASMGIEGTPRISGDAPGWTGLRAVRDGHVVPVHDERILRAGPRIAEGLAVLARTLHPDTAIP